LQLSLLVLPLWAATPAPSPAPVIPTTDEELVINQLIERTPNMVAPPTVLAKTNVGQSTIPVMQRTVISSARTEDLKAFFRAQLEMKGFYIAPEQDKFAPEKGQQITGLDTENLVAYMALFQPSGKLTTVVIAAANVGKPAGASQSNQVIAPLFPGGRNVTSYHVEMMKGMTYECTGTPAEIKKFYREELGKQGYKETEDLVFQKKAARVFVVISPGVVERGVAVYLQNAPEGGDIRDVPPLTPPKVTVP
jgi:hypothetical protein